MLRLLAALGGPIAGLFVTAPSYRLAKIVGGVVAALALVALLSVGKCVYDRNLIEQHDSNRDREIAEDTTKADRTADEKAAPRQAEFQNSQDALANAAASAKAADPEGAKKGVGPVSRSYYDTLPEKKK